MSQTPKFQDLEETGADLLDFIKSSEVDKLQSVEDSQHFLHEQRSDTKKTVTQILTAVAQVEENAGQTLLEMHQEKKKLDLEFHDSEEQLRKCTAKSQHLDSDMQFLQKEFENFLSDDQDLETLQKEVNEDTTEVIPSSVRVAKLFSHITRIKWEYDSEHPHVVKGGADHLRESEDAL